MKIAHDAIAMDSSRTYLEKEETRESLRVWIDQPGETASLGIDRVTISSRAEQLLDRNDREIAQAGLSANNDPEISLKKLIAEILSGREVEILHIEKVNRQAAAASGEAAADGSQTSGRQGWGVQYDAQSMYSESEQVSFNARGVIQTADGKQVTFSLKLEMSREYVETANVSFRAGDAAIDPLVINFDGTAAELTDLKFDFDLNADGNQESISMPTAGSGFLALDLNGDGTINDGSELFGPSTGNGFAELQAYDKDGNAWIDESDDAFDDLRIMTVDQTGVSTLSTLKSSGVGAIYLGNESTRFDIRSGSGSDLLGQVRTTGIYLKEDGTLDTIQLLDLIA